VILCGSVRRSESNVRVTEQLIDVSARTDAQRSALDAEPPTQVAPLARAAVLRALAIDASLGDAHAALGSIALHYEWNWPAAEAVFQPAIRLLPRSHAADSGPPVSTGKVLV
jgi:hypothetical protein